MRYSDLIESIDQTEADAVYRSLKATGDDLVALYFQATRNDTKHTTIDSAQRAAERMAASASKKIAAAQAAQDDRDRSRSAKRPLTPVPKLSTYVPPKEYSDNFRGNQYVQRARAELPPGLKQFLPILDRGLSAAISSSWGIGKRIGSILTQS